MTKQSNPVPQPRWTSPAQVQQNHLLQCTHGTGVRRALQNHLLKST